VDINYVNQLLGAEITSNNVVKILRSLEVEIKNQKSKIKIKRGSTSLDQHGPKRSNLYLEVEIPTFRLDLKTQEDLIEEIGRIYGYEKIKPQAPKVEVKMPALAEDRKFARLVKRILAGKGFSEVYNYSFYSEHDANMAMLGDLQHLELANPMNPDQALMRVSLIPGILKNVRENIKRYKDISIFEIGKVYWPNKSTLPEEKNILVGAIHAEKKKYTKLKKQDTNFYEAKGYVDALLEMLGIDDFYFDTCEAAPADTPLALWHESRTAAIKIEGQDETIGYIGEINPLVLVNFEISKRVAVFELDMEKLRAVTEKENEYKPLRIYPDVMRDISMVSPGGVLVDEILQSVQAAGGDLVLDVDLFDIYDFNDGTSSYAFHIIFGATNRTLENAEVDKIMEKIVKALETDLKVKIRK
jgi:phenylalanyl-tRNA synthetase beta chain